MAATNGAYPKLERYRWSGIAFVNPERTQVEVMLNARTDSGEILAQSIITLRPGQRKVAVAEDLFPGQDIGTATYISFSADIEIIGFQLNGSAADTMLDAIPVPGSAQQVRSTHTFRINVLSCLSFQLPPRPPLGRPLRSGPG